MAIALLKPSSVVSLTRILPQHLQRIHLKATVSTALILVGSLFCSKAASESKAKNIHGYDPCMQHTIAACWSGTSATKCQSVLNPSSADRVTLSGA